MDDIYKLKYLAGITDKQGNTLDKKALEGSNLSIIGSEKARIQREKKIQPGTNEWFKLWFARPRLTGEKPTGK
ncbi:hypothetical protein [Winogradskyella sp.]|uniref:hypothetical protein n=1 Tax=Winogradskyella sp. TaxID=1883156 RepID=UPI003511FFE9